MAATDLHTLATFKAHRLGRNLTTSDPDIQNALDMAACEVDPAVWGGLTELGHGLLTRIYLDSDAYDTEGRLETLDGETSYERHFDRLRRIVGMVNAPRVTGSTT